MKLIRQITDLNKAIKDEQRLGFVPTMGGLHKGHESLIKISKKKSNKTLVSIFINPKQFNNKDDFRSYPRNLKNDLILLKKLKVDFIFIPSVNLIFGKKKLIEFKFKKTQKILCAKHRKGHFEGVLNVMDRLVNLISPKIIFMGEKDFQQFFLVKDYIEKKYNTNIHCCKTIRNKKKVALSTRNYLLHPKDLNKAALIANILIRLKKTINKNRKNVAHLIIKKKKDLIKKFNIKIEYLEARNTIDLNSNIINKKYKIFIAYYLNHVRLIDNF
tara:strand:+ start:929 stop:1744 length:816 start_codon:yes stop_codon:yes gene_type:complete